MSFVKSLVRGRVEMNSVLLAEKNEQAQLLSGADLGFVGMVQHGGRYLACYSADILESMGVGEDKRVELNEVCFISKGFLDFDSVYLAALHRVEVEPEQLSLAELMKKRGELGERALSLIEDCARCGIDLPQALVFAIQSREGGDK